MSDYSIADDDLVVSPLDLEFQEKNTSEKTFVIENYAEEAVIFRVRVSASNVFVLQASTGIVDAQHSVEVPISLKKSLPADFMHAEELTVKLAVEFVLYSPEYESRGSKAFWIEQGKDAIRKTIMCVVTRASVHKGSVQHLDAQKLGAFEGGLGDKAVPGSSQMEISPQQLEFEENQYQCEDVLTIHNPSANAVAYRVVPSAIDVYIIARGNGVVMPGASTKIPVVLLEVPMAASKEEAQLPHTSKLLIDLLDVDEGFSDKTAKIVWKEGARRVVHTTVSCIAKRIKRLSAEVAQVSPEALLFHEGNNPLEDQIVIHNAGFCSVAYIVKVSVPGLFTMQKAAGVVAAGETAAVSVFLKGFPKSTGLGQTRKRNSTEGVPLAKFSVDLMDVDEDYDHKGATEFWSIHANDLIRRSVGSLALPGKTAEHIESKVVQSKSPASKIWAQSNRSFESFSFDGPELAHSNVECSVVEEAILRDHSIAPSSRRPSNGGVPLLSVFPDSLYFMEGDEPLADTIIIHNIGSSNTSLVQMKCDIAYRITSSTPSRFSFEDGNDMGVIKFDQVVEIRVVLHSFPGLLASDDTPIAEFSVDFTRCDESYNDYEPNTFWSSQVGDKFIRKIVSGKAIGYEDRERVENRLEASDPGEALTDYDGLSQFINESPAVTEPKDTSISMVTTSSGNIFPVAQRSNVGGVLDPALAAPSASVYPKCIFFLEGDEPMEDFIRIMNTSSVPILFRVYSSLPKKFVIPIKDGALDANESVNVSVKLKSFPSNPPNDDSLANFFVEFVFYDDSYFTMDPVLFWRDQGDVYLRKVVLCRAVNWEGREAIDARKRSLSMAEVPIEFNGYLQLNEKAEPNDHDDVIPGIEGQARLAALNSDKNKTSETSANSSLVTAWSLPQQPSLEAVAPDEERNHKERRESINMFVAELSTALDDDVSLKKMSPAVPPPLADSGGSPVSNIVMDEMKFFMRHANESEMLLSQSTSQDPESGGRTDVHQLSTGTLDANETTTATQKAAVNPVAPTVQQLHNGPHNQPTQRRVSWIRACELLRVNPTNLEFKVENKGMSASILLHNTALEPLVYRLRPSHGKMLSVSPSEGVIDEDEKVSVLVTSSASVLDSLLDSFVLATVVIDIMEFDDSYGTMGSQAYWNAYSVNCVCKSVSVTVVGARNREMVDDDDATTAAIALTPKSIPAAAIRRHSLVPKIEPPKSPLSRLDSIGLQEAEKVEIFPSCLKFIQGEGRLVDSILFNNTSTKPISFRIRVSVPNLFVLKTSEGVLDPGQKLSIPVVLKSFPNDASESLAKFAVEMLECDDSYYIMGPKAFWKGNGEAAIRHTVLSKAVESPFPIQASKISAVSAASRRGSFAGTRTSPVGDDSSLLSPGSSPAPKSMLSRRRSSMGGPVAASEIREITQPTRGSAVGAVVVHPLCLTYLEGSDILKDTLTLNNTSSKSISFRIRVSVPNLFVLKTSEGVLDPGQKLNIPVVLKSFPKLDPTHIDEIPIAKFAVEMLECDDEYYILGSKEFWKVNSSRAVRSSVQSQAVRATKEIFADDLDDFVRVMPDCLCFNENDDPLQSSIDICNDSSTSVVFRLRVSVQNMFVLKTTEGVIEPSKKTSIPVVLKTFPPVRADDTLAKFSVEFLECDDDYYIMGSKEFWKARNSSIVCKKILSKAVFGPENEKMQIKQDSTTEDDFEVSPGCLVYREGEDSMKELLRLNNKSDIKHFAFRIRVSIPNIFVLKNNEGVLDPGQKLSIPVALKSFPPSDILDSDGILAKFAIEFLECSEDYYLMGAKAFWKANEGSHYSKKIVSKAISKLKLSDLQRLPLSDTTIVSPPILYFSDGTLMDTLAIINNGLITVAFRIMVSVPNLFTLRVTEGVLNPCQELTIPVLLRELPEPVTDTSLLAKFAIEFVQCDDEYYIVGPKEYWKNNKDKTFRKKIVAERGIKIVNAPKLAPKVEDLMRQSELVPLRAVEQVECFPKSLHFKVGDFISENFIELSNKSELSVAYRIRVSVQNMFVVENADGVLVAKETRRVSVSSKPTTIYESAEDVPTVKFAVELLQVDERYDELGPKVFWKRYSPEGLRVSVLTTFSVSNLKPVARKRSGSPNRVSWADSTDRPEQASLSVMSPNAEKHKKHIAEMESILNDLKGQLASEPPKEGQVEGVDVNIEDILKIGKALLKESVDLTKEEGIEVTPSETQSSSGAAEVRHADSERFQSRPAPLDVANSNDGSVSNVCSIAAPKPFTKPRGRLFELMVKNVSRDQLLTSEEAEELKQIRELMTKPHWDEWLADARAEKKRRKAVTQVTDEVDVLKSKTEPSPRVSVQKKIIGKKTIKSINRLVKKKEADHSIGVLKDALEHLWAKVVDSSKTPSAPSPQPPIATNSLENPGAVAKALLADIQSQLASNALVDNGEIVDKMAALEQIISSMSSVTSDAAQERPITSNSTHRSVLPTSPAYSQSLERNDLSGSYNEELFGKPKHMFDDDLGLFTPPHWKGEKQSFLNASFDGSVGLFNSSKGSPHERKRTANLSASLPVPRTTSTRSHSAPRVRPRASTPSKTSGRSISHKIRGGQRAGKIERWCFTIGAHNKAFDDYPIRVDAQVATVDVVWREKRYDMGGAWKSVDPLSRGASVLRRERFQFDDIFWGPTGEARLGGSSRQRAVEAMIHNTDLCFLCLAAGERGDEKKTGGLMEPPITLLLGDQGGQGLISGIVDEIFRYLGDSVQPPSQLLPDPNSSYGRSAQSLHTSAVTASIILSAVVICDGHISDLLTPSTANNPRGATVKRLPDGRNILYNIGRVRLHSAADFERVVGVLCGRRSAIRQIVRASQNINEGIDIEADVVVDDNSCMLITVSVTGFNLAGGGEQNYYFVCPSGDKWRLPGDEICMLSEAISALPHPSPPSLIANSILVQLIADPAARATDFISVSSVVRPSATSSGDTPQSPSRVNQFPSEASKDQMVQESLQALRVVTKLSLLV